MNRLRELRQARGWSQPRLIVALEQQAKLDNVSLGATRASLKTRISMWENDRSAPDETYRSLLSHALGVTEDELGIDQPEEPSTLTVPAQSIAVPSMAVTPEVVGFLRNTFDQYVQADRLLGPRAVMGLVSEQCKLIENLVDAASGSIRPEILNMGARFFEFGGWLAQDSGDFETAATWSARALDMAYEAGNDPWFISYIFMRRSNVATESGDRSRGVGLAQAALRDGAHLGPRLNALILRQQAGALALAGDEHGSARAIDEALTSVMAGGEAEPHAGYCSPSYVQMEGANAWSRLGRPDKAVELLTDALDAWPEGNQRDKGMGIARLATAQAMGGDVDAACAAARQAAGVVQAAPSARAIAELSSVRARLAPWRSSREVAEVTDLLRSLS